MPESLRIFNLITSNPRTHFKNGVGKKEGRGMDTGPAPVLSFTFTFVLVLSLQQPEAAVAPLYLLEEVVVTGEIRSREQKVPFIGILVTAERAEGFLLP